jgi:2-polyprenyl-6-methoxyphenol hydroxylase-like FAD-dependent oxidoreductase
MTSRQDPSSASSGPIEVLVVGAGPTGLALAAHLATYGIRVRIIDRQSDRVHESRALAIQPRTLEVLADLGVTPALLDHGRQAVQLRVHLPRRVVSVRLFDLGLADTAYPFLLFLSQAQTERILGDHLAQQRVTIQRQTELVQLSPAGDHVGCRLRHPDGRLETVAARYVVGCDGAHSTVRQQAGIGFEGAAYPQTFLLADLEVDGLEPDAAHAWLTGAGMAFFFPLGEPATWRLLAMRPPDGQTPSDAEVSLAELQAVTDSYATDALRLRDPAWMTRFRLHLRRATSYRAGRVFLAGDAAHVHSPAGGQGMNTGIQDATNLAWKLALTCNGAAAPELLDTYELERAPVGRRVLRLTDRAFTIATSTNPLLRWGRTQLPRLATLAPRMGPVRAAAFRTLSELAIGYRHSPAASQGPNPPRRGPHAGDRLPDAPLASDGGPTSLHAATAATGFHLLLCGPENSWPPATLVGPWRDAGVVAVDHLSREAAPGALHDPDGTALRRLGLDPAGQHTAHYLVRPDGHVGYRAGGTDLTALHAYLTRWLPGIPSP